jgi:drug/metabolite transporter (DMT)-like permease
MKPLIMLMLAVQAGIFLVTVWTILFARPAAGRPRPIWSGLALALVIVAGTSWNIGESHAGQPGADILMYGAPLLLGMAIMAALLLLRQRRGLDGPA